MINKIQESDVLNILTGAAYVSGQPIVAGFIKGVCVANIASGAIGPVATSGVFDLSVKAINGSGNSAVAIGDKIYFVIGDTPVLSKKDTGVPFGYALEGITSGSTDTIQIFVPKGGL